MEFIRCPYDATPLSGDTRPGGFGVVACQTCGAEWEWRATRLRRTREPDRVVVRAAREEQVPARHREPGPA